ncbi:g4003 [Coccomyxa viridis]|uniref:Kinesin-like protein n=1 Tax=Coccomyxa viridis TaxID=1274662 RepID=A0ABP1FS11_9CHLO
MGSSDPWEQLSALEKKASKRAGDERLPSVENGSACAASEVSTSYNGESGENFQVVIRVRPPLQRELEGYQPFRNTALVDPGQRKLTVSENAQSIQNGANPSDIALAYATYSFTFDWVYGPDSFQSEVYDKSAKGTVLSTLQGYNAAIIAYGQTGTGKTFTMEGEREGPQRGIIPRAVEDIFTCIESDTATGSKYLVRASYLQIYNEVISDLLKPERHNLTIKEDKKRGVFVDGLSEWVVRSPQEVYGLLERGAMQRATGTTKMNELSSRSHAVFIIIIEKSTVTSRQEADGDEMEQFRGLAPGMGRMENGQPAGGEMMQCVKVGKLNLVDLAGSERVHITGATGKRLEESKKINQSLSCLGNVIAALTDSRGLRTHVPYRDSKLTRILEDSLGGNCKTTMMATVSPALEAFPETVSTLKFAHRAKSVRNTAHVNEDADQRTLLRKYEQELRKLRAELQMRQREVVDKRHLLAVEEQKRRAEADKLAAITALEQRSREFMREKEEKRRLETRIANMQSQLLIGGSKLEDTPVFRTLLAREQRRMRGEYEIRLRELERERIHAEQDKAQVDRYKGLLVKQRDIMTGLTGRLNERDEQILRLQEELEAYDSHQKRLEDALDSRTAELIALRKAAVEHTAASPIKSAPLQSALGAWASGPSPLGRGSSAILSSSSKLLDTNGMVNHPAALLSSTSSDFSDMALLERRRSSGTAASMIETELGALREQSLTHVKERVALKAILDDKVRALISDIGQSVAELPIEVRQHPKLLRQVLALDKLVAATVKALSSASANAVHSS